MLGKQQLVSWVVEDASIEHCLLAGNGLLYFAQGLVGEEHVGCERQVVGNEGMEFGSDDGEWPGDFDAVLEQS